MQLIVLTLSLSAVKRNQHLVASTSKIHFSTVFTERLEIFVRFAAVAIFYRTHAVAGIEYFFFNTTSFATRELVLIFGTNGFTMK
jgi:hypothetical protein